ncbi:MAG: single-stranded DNA-binding protein [Treponema sp.]|nr:single-stranded DNA-binding protein [Treponema sp.]
MSFVELQKISSALAAECDTLRFGSNVKAVYNPLVYAAEPHNMYLELAGKSPKKVIFLGMNPGPWGMAQTGVPFGEVAAVREWLGIEANVAKPAQEHPKRPVLGFASTRSEVSGRRLWGLFRERFKTPAKFFRRHFVANYCPLVFMEQGGANITPDKLPAHEAAALFEACDRALAATINVLKPDWVIGVGGFAKKRIDRLNLDEKPFSTAQILHPSPASPRANAGWSCEVTKTLVELGVWD